MMVSTTIEVTEPSPDDNHFHNCDSVSTASLDKLPFGANCRGGGSLTVTRKPKECQQIESQFQQPRWLARATADLDLAEGWSGAVVTCPIAKCLLSGPVSPPHCLRTTRKAHVR
jgi:hypothetical protein